MKNLVAVIGTCILVLGCRSDTSAPVPGKPGIEHLNARPLSGVTTVAAATYVLSVNDGLNCCMLQVPERPSSSGKLPLLVMLHGAGFTPAAVAMMFALGEELDFAVLAPRAAKPSWDIIYGGFGPDIARIDASLAKTFQMLDVDPNAIALAGFSDGASYALSVGLANGDLFTHVIAFSPGFIAPVPRIGKPRFFLVHGRGDGTLPFRTTETAFVPFLRTLGYSVEFNPFDGGHVLNEAEARKALTWFLNR